MKILVIRFSSIGDILMTTPVLRCLKSQLPDVEVHFLTKKKFHFVLQDNPHIDKFYLLEDSLGKVTDALRKEKYDYIADLHHNLRSLLVKISLRRKSSAYYKANIEKWLMVNFKINRLPHTHTSERFLKTLQPLGVQDDGKGLDYYFHGPYSLQEMLPATHLSSYTGFIIGGSYFTRRMPNEKIAAIIDRLNGPVVLLGGPEDRERGQAIGQLTKGSTFNACGLFSFDQSAFLVKNARHIITHDTSLMHVAAAFDKKIVSVWGHNLPEFGNYPFRVSDSSIVGITGLPCRPCSKNGTRTCPQKHFKCMRTIDAAYVAELAEQTK